MKTLMKIPLWALAVTPIIVTSLTFYPFSTGKVLFSRLCVVVAAVLFVVALIGIVKFRSGVLAKIKTFRKRPLVIAIVVFVVLSLVSAVFAVDVSWAFWGDLERSGGFIALVFYFLSFVFSLLVFEKKDWIIFFKLAIIVACVVLFRGFIEFFQGIERPGSFFGNASYLGGYLLFTIFFSLVLLYYEKNKWWRYFAGIVAVLSLLGIFVTETRGAILGIFAGAIVLLIYAAVRGKDAYYKKIPIRRAAFIILGCIFIFLAIFFGTLKTGIWDHVPGVSRIATIRSEEDSITVMTRLFAWRSSLASVNPKTNGAKKFLVGWGPNNFSLAFAQYYYPEHFRYEGGWFDRAHNRLFDALVMTGVIGLVAYLAIWVLYARLMWKRKEFSLLNGAFVFIGASFFVYLLFMFEYTTISLFFFFLLAFALYVEMYGDNDEERGEVTISTKASVLLILPFFLITAFVFGFFIRNDLVGLAQMKRYYAFRKTMDASYLIEDQDKVFSRATTAQEEIRRDFLESTAKNIIAGREKADSPIFIFAASLAEEYSARRPSNFKFMITIANAYRDIGKELNNMELLSLSDDHIKKALTFAPNRPDLWYLLAMNFAYQKRYDESVETIEQVIAVDEKIPESYYYLGVISWIQQGASSCAVSVDNYEKAIDLDPNFFREYSSTLKDLYVACLEHFYKVRDKERFIKTAERLVQDQKEAFPQGEALRESLEQLQEKGTWPLINFK